MIDILEMIYKEHPYMFGLLVAWFLLMCVSTYHSTADTVVSFLKAISKIFGKEDTYIFEGDITKYTTKKSSDKKNKE